MGAPARVYARYGTAFMVAPSYVAVGLTPGRQIVAFSYESFRYYPWLFGVGAIALLALWLAPELLATRKSNALEPEDAGC